MSMVLCHTALNHLRQLKLNKVDFGEVLNALESAQLNLTSLQLVACNGILDLGRLVYHYNLMTFQSRCMHDIRKTVITRLSRICPALECLELYYCTNGSATASSPVRLPRLSSVTIYR